MAIAPISQGSSSELLLEKLSQFIDKLGNVNHEELQNIHGGDENGHYHLTNDEYTKLGKLITKLFSPDGSEVVIDVDTNQNHEALENLKGGSSGGHYHLTESELNGLVLLISRLLDSTGKHIEISHEKDLADLLGGATSGHYHLTRAQLDKLENLPISSSSIEVINNLNSTSATAALSAAQGRQLRLLLNKKIDTESTKNEAWEFTLEDNTKVSKEVVLLT